MMRIAVFGAGGVGGYFGGRLAQAGEDVTFIARGKHLEAMKSGGLRVDSIKGDFKIVPVQATDNPREVGEVDAVIVAVKAWQLSAAAMALRPMIGPGTCVVSLGNGVDGPERLSEAIGKDHVLGGLCRISAFLSEPGYIRHVGIEPWVAIGELDNHPTQRVEALRQAFARAGVQATIPADIAAATWEKFLFIAAISGIGAVTRSQVGIIRGVPESRALLEAALQEVYSLAVARGIALPADSVSKTLSLIDGLPAGTLPSMTKDIIEGKPSELDAQTGAVVGMGKELGVPTPVNAFIYGALLPQELQARGRSPV